MKANVNGQLEVLVRRAAVALIAKAAVAAGTVYASPPNPVVAVPPTDLLALARQTGDATLLQETVDGKRMFYIEQNQGARLVTFDVTDPLRIKGAGSVHLDASGLVDFVSLVGNQAELARFQLVTPQGLTWVDPMTGALKVTHPTMGASPALNYFGAIDPVFTYELNRMFDVKQVRAQMTRTDTGANFMPSEDGL